MTDRFKSIHKFSLLTLFAFIVFLIPTTVFATDIIVQNRSVYFPPTRNVSYDIPAFDPQEFVSLYVEASSAYNYSVYVFLSSTPLDQIIQQYYPNNDTTLLLKTLPLYEIRNLILSQEGNHLLITMNSDYYEQDLTAATIPHADTLRYLIFLGEAEAGELSVDYTLVALPKNAMVLLTISSVLFTTTFLLTLIGYSFALLLSLIDLLYFLDSYKKPSAQAQSTPSSSASVQSSSPSAQVLNATSVSSSSPSSTSTSTSLSVPSSSSSVSSSKLSRDSREKSKPSHPDFYETIRKASAYELAIFGIGFSILLFSSMYFPLLPILAVSLMVIAISMYLYRYNTRRRIIKILELYPHGISMTRLKQMVPTIGNLLIYITDINAFDEARIYVSPDGSMVSLHSPSPNSSSSSAAPSSPAYNDEVKKLKKQGVTQPESGHICMFCGATVPEGSKFCPECGASLH